MGRGSGWGQRVGGRRGMGWSRYGRFGTCRRAFKRMDSREGDEQVRSTADAVARRSYGKLVAFLAARTNDVASAEDALSEAFAAALADWPRNGFPSNPEAWLVTVARRKIIDVFRRPRPDGVASCALPG